MTYGEYYTGGLMKNHIIIICLIFGIIILSNGCSDANELSLNLEANEQANMNRGGWVFVQNEWIYYCNLSDNWSLYKMKINGTDKMLLSEHISHFIHVDNDWIFFNAAPQEFFGEEGVLCKMKIDGTSFSVVTTDNAIFPKYIDEYIYYINSQNSQDSEIYRIKQDGSDRKQITNDDVVEFIISDNWIYYIDNNRKLFRIGLDGKEKIKLSDDSISEFLLTTDKVVYVNERENNYIFTIDLDGERKKKLSDVSCYGMVLYNNYIVYINMDDKNKLYKTNLDRKENVKICDDVISSINIIDDWIYYINAGDNKLYRIKIDGTRNEIMD